MFDAIDRHLLEPVINNEQHPVVTDPQAITITTGQLLNLMVAGLTGQLLDSLEDSTLLITGDRAQVFLDAAVVRQRIHGG